MCSNAVWFCVCWTVPMLSMEPHRCCSLLGVRINCSPRLTNWTVLIIIMVFLWSVFTIGWCCLQRLNVNEVLMLWFCLQGLCVKQGAKKTKYMQFKIINCYPFKFIVHLIAWLKSIKMSIWYFHNHGYACLYALSWPRVLKLSWMFLWHWALATRKVPNFSFPIKRWRIFIYPSLTCYCKKMPKQLVYYFYLILRRTYFRKNAKPVSHQP